MPKKASQALSPVQPTSSMVEEIAQVALEFIAELYEEGDEIVDTLVLLEIQLKEVLRLAPSYLRLPAVLSVLEKDRMYLAALPWGRASYRASLHVLDEETASVVRVPRTWQLSEVLDVVDQSIRPPDRRLAVVLPLSWRVGTAVGWLSGLAVSQEEEAQKGMLVLAALVAPLLGTSGSLYLSSQSLPAARRSSSKQKKGY
jgi:hypothetical protein